MAGKRFVKLAYTGRVKDGEIFDSTSEEIAKREGFYSEEKFYSPMTVVVGEGQVLAGLDDAISGMKLGEEKEVVIPPEKAYGHRNPDHVRLVSLGEFRKKNINPIPGMPVELDGRRARIQTVSGGRVRVDFNHELAGKTLVFEVKLVDEAKTRKQKINYVIERSFNSSEDFDVKTGKNEVEIKLPEKIYKDKNLLLRKASLSAELFRYLGVGEVVYTESWKNPESAVKEEKK